MYTANYKEPVFSIAIENTIDLNRDGNQSWVVLCFDASIGLSSLKKINRIVNNDPGFNFCDS